MTKAASVRPNEVFLSHAARDRRGADRLASALRRHGVPVWYSQTNIVGARQWHDEIGDALARCDWFVLLLSPNSVRSRWVKHELHYALRDQRYDERIMPVVLRPCEPARLSWTLPGIQMVDASQDFHEACRQILRTWGIGYQEARQEGGPTDPTRRRRRL